MKQQTFLELSDKVSTAVNWVESLGVRVGPTRLAKYKRTLERNLRNQTGNPSDGITHGQFLAIVFEAGMFVNVFENFPRNHINILKSKLGIILKGPEYQEEETTKNNHARNIQYELVLASRLSKYGIEIGFANEEKEDLHFYFEGIKYFCECKRPFSENGIEDGLKDAITQLRTRIKNENEKGLVAISLDRVSNYNHLAPVFTSFQHADKAITDHISETMNKHADFISKKKTEKIAGMFCSLYTPVVLATKPDDLVEYGMDACLPFDYPNTKNWNEVERISRYLSERLEND